MLYVVTLGLAIGTGVFGLDALDHGPTVWDLILFTGGSVITIVTGVLAVQFDRIDRRRPGR